MFLSKNDSCLAWGLRVTNSPHFGHFECMLMYSNVRKIPMHSFNKRRFFFIDMLIKRISKLEAIS